MSNSETSRPQARQGGSPMQTVPGGELAAYFRSASFNTSSARFSQCPDSPGPEVAFAGRSNAGKSSAINKLCDQKQLARTSKTPGRTQLINFFDLADGKCLVDLPGYGYAKVSESKKREWQLELERYLQQRKALVMLVLLVDCRHALQPFDRMMLDWTGQSDLRCHVLLTKSDKLSRNKARQSLFALQREIAGMENASAQLFSAHSGEGLDEARSVIFARLHAAAHRG